ncbi:hypothetical protein LAWASA_2954 [Lawsonibacter asaccharolyticus]|nr:hypothetical protein LAWASA_2954 [Lawsonibacter asaccharolyticus]
MELRVLRYFLAIAREENITAAANYLHMTQPTLSRQIRDLEEELGQKLLVRGSHRVTLTAEGMLLRKRAEEIVAMADKTEDAFRAMKGDLSGDIYIGGGETDAMNLIATVCRELQEEHPGIRYHLFSGNAQDVTERLDKGLLDFGLLIQPTDIAKYDYLSLPAKDTWGVILRRDAPLATKSCVRVEDLVDVPLIFSRQALEERAESNELARWFGAAWNDLNIVTTFNLCYNASVMAKQGLGYVVSLDKLVDTSEDSLLCFLPLEPPLESGLDVVWKKYQVFSAAAEAFLNRLRERCLK